MILLCTLPGHPVEQVVTSAPVLLALIPMAILYIKGAISKIRGK